MAKRPSVQEFLRERVLSFMSVISQMLSAVYSTASIYSISLFAVLPSVTLPASSPMREHPVNAIIRAMQYKACMYGCFLLFIFFECSCFRNLSDVPIIELGCHQV